MLTEAAKTIINKGFRFLAVLLSLRRFTATEILKWTILYFVLFLKKIELY